MPTYQFVDTLIVKQTGTYSGCAELVFANDALQVPGLNNSGLPEPADYPAPLPVVLKENVKNHALKIKLQDENGCTIASVCVPPCQWQWRLVESNNADPCDNTNENDKVLQLNVLNAQLWADYVLLEGAGFYNQESRINVHNLFCGAEKHSQIIQAIVANNAAINENVDVTEEVKCISDSVHLDLLKIRAVAQVELCKCGKSCVARPVKVGSNFCVERALGCQNHH